MSSIPAVDPALTDFLVVTEVDSDLVARHLFERKYGHRGPDFPHHIVALYRRDDGCLEVASYLHFFPFGDIMLIGGACTDGAVLRRMAPAQQAAVQSAGGLMLQTTRYALQRFAPRCDAVFGHCGDARSYDVLVAAGFAWAGPPHLIVHWTREPDAMHRRALIAKAAAIGPF